MPRAGAHVVWHVVWRVLRDGPARLAGSLGGRLLLILASVGLIGASALMLLLVAVITPSFNALERRSIDAQVDRVTAALDGYALGVERSARHYGDRIGGDARPAHPDAARAGLHVAYIPPDDRAAPGRRVGRGMARDQDAMLAIAHGAAVERMLAGTGAGHFYARLGDGVVAVAVARAGDGGMVVATRRITATHLGAMLQAPVRLEPADRSVTMVTAHADTLDIAVPVRGADTRPVAVVRFAVPRDLSILGRHVLMLASAGAILLMAIVLLVLSRMVARLVLRPLGAVERHMQRVRASGSLAVLDAVSDRRDEIGSLGRSFNAMLVQLRDLREQVEAQSFALGRSESAVAVMHNVRNALNPISTMMSAGIGQAPPADRALIDRALEELAGADVAPDRRVALTRFLAAAFAAEDRLRAERREQLGIGRDAMRQVLEIIGAQQALAHERPPLETCDATQLIAQNAAIARHWSGAAVIAVRFADRPCPVLANRILLSQVIGNLFSNAADAIAAGGGAGEIVVTVEGGSGATVEIAIRDSGEGFDPESAAHLFQRGFSTRATKSGGLGLHWCANAMASMDGALRLESAGVGQGAVARLTLRAPDRDTGAAPLAA